jgi:agmatine deiminase
MVKQPRQADNENRHEVLVKRGCGVRMPAEWEPHEATWIAWPHHRDDWPGKFEAIPWVYAEIVRHLHQSEEVRILVNGPAGERRARAVLEKLPLDWVRIVFYRVPTDRVWTRDFGPYVVLGEDGRRCQLNWQFNGWAKYPNHERDNNVSIRVAKHLLRPCDWVNPSHNGHRVVLEGGSIDVNGAGLLLTTEECLLSDVQQRNPSFTRADYEAVFAEYLGVRKVLWLNRGIAGDDTHGHVDDLARFVGPCTVVTAVEDDPSDGNYAPLRENLERLRGMTDLDGRPLEVVPLPMPRAVVFDGQRLPASYANFYIANDRVLVPTFNDPADRRALGVLAELFPDRKVVGIHAVDLVWGLGTLHCLTQQQPAVEPTRSKTQA